MINFKITLTSFKHITTMFTHQRHASKENATYAPANNPRRKPSPSSLKMKWKLCFFPQEAEPTLKIEVAAVRNRFPLSTRFWTRFSLAFFIFWEINFRYPSGTHSLLVLLSFDIITRISIMLHCNTFMLVLSVFGNKPRKDFYLLMQTCKFSVLYFMFALSV